MSKQESLVYKKQIDVTSILPVRQETSHEHQGFTHSNVRRSSEKRTLILSAPAFDQTHVFQVRKSEGFVSNLTLSFDIIDGGTLETSDAQAFQFVEKVEIYFDSEKVMDLRGEELQLLLLHANKNNVDLWTPFVYLPAGGDGNVTGGNLTVRMPLLYPGFEGKMDSQHIPIQVKNLGTEMEIRIKLRNAVNSFSVVGGSTIDKMSLKYLSWEIEGDVSVRQVLPVIDVNRVGKFPTGSNGLLMNANVETGQLNIENAFHNLEVVEFLLTIHTDAEDALNNRLSGVRLNKLEFTINAKDYRKYDTDTDIELGFFDHYKKLNTFTVNSIERYYYAINFAVNPESIYDSLNRIQEHGMDLNNENVRISFSTANTDNYIFNMFAVNRRYVTIEKGENAVVSS